MKDMNHLVNFGLINIDKPSGPTSFNVSEFVRRKLGLTKTSHMGTLDPAVSGVLPITLGRACRLASHFIRHDKDYVGVLETHKNCDLKVLQGLIDENFSGKIMQTPPHKSAVKRVEREREVYSFEFKEDVINQFKIKDFKLELGEIKDDNLRRYNKKIEDVSGVGKDLKDGFFAVFCGKDFVGIYKVVEGWSNKGKSKIFAKAEFVFN